MCPFFSFSFPQYFCTFFFLLSLVSKHKEHQRRTRQLSWEEVIEFKLANFLNTLYVMNRKPQLLLQDNFIKTNDASMKTGIAIYVLASKKLYRFEYCQ